MTLLDLDMGHLSLEFHPSDTAMLLRRFRRFGRVSRVGGVTYDLLVVGDERFVLLDDLEGPALVSRSSAGDAILREAVRSGGRIPSGMRRRSFRDRALADALAA